MGEVDVAYFTRSVIVLTVTVEPPLPPTVPEVKPVTGLDAQPGTGSVKLIVGPAIEAIARLAINKAVFFRLAINRSFL